MTKTKLRKSGPARVYDVGVLLRQRIIRRVRTTSRRKALQLAKAGFGEERMPAKPSERRRNYVKRVA